MLDLFIKLTRAGVIVFWLAFVLALKAVIPEPAATTIAWFGGLVLVAHLAEFIYAKYVFAGLDRDEVSFTKTMLFGFTHLVPLLNNKR